MTVKELEEYYSGRSLPAEPHKINGFETVIDFNQYVQANLEGIEKDPNPYFKPCMMQLIELKEWLEANVKILYTRLPTSI